MRKTLLELVQDILASLESDEVNSIFDGTESQDVARIVRDCYETLIVEVAPKSRKGLFHLDASTDNTKPVLMRMPQDARSIEWMKYNIGNNLQDTNFRDICYLEPMDFINHTNGLDEGVDWVDSMTVDFDGHPFQIKFRNDVSPYYYTSPDNVTILFDSYDAGLEQTLTSSRTYCYGNKAPVFRMEDDFIPTLDDTHFPLLLNMAKSQAFTEMKQTENPNSERRERRLRILSKKTVDTTDNRPEIYRRKGYGRK